MWLVSVMVEDTLQSIQERLIILHLIIAVLDIMDILHITAKVNRTVEPIARYNCIPCNFMDYIISCVNGIHKKFSKLYVAR